MVNYIYTYIYIYALAHDVYIILKAYIILISSMYIPLAMLTPSYIAALYTLGLSI